MNDKSHDPLPDELLPRSAIDADGPTWDNRVQSLMAAAAPLLAEYRKEPVPWWAMLTERLMPRLTVAVAAAAALTIAVHLALPRPAAQHEASLPLAAVAGEGDDATTLWSIVNDEVDPVLALVILEGETP
jgi:hypothetical protein